MGFDAVFLAGVLSFFSPCILPLLPIYMARLAGADRETVSPDGAVQVRKTTFNWRLISQTSIFVAGISTSFVLLGFGAGFVGQILSSQVFLAGCGIVAIVLGIHQTGLIRFRLLEREKKISSKRSLGSGMGGAYLLGLTFSFGWTPCVGPVLATVLALASTQGQAFAAVLLMLVYSAGLAIPFILISILGNRALDGLKRMNRHLPKIQVASGLLIIVMGVLLMTNNLNVLSGIIQW